MRGKTYTFCSWILTQKQPNHREQELPASEHGKILTLRLMKKSCTTWDAQQGVDSGEKTNIWGILNGAGFFHQQYNKVLQRKPQNQTGIFIDSPKKVFWNSRLEVSDALNFTGNGWNPKLLNVHLPRHSMYGLFTYIYHKNQPFM